MRKIWMLVLFVMVLLALPTQAKSVNELKRLAVEEIVPEVRQAAVLALSEWWAGSELSDAGLRQLALEDPAPALRSAAARALGLRQVQHAISLDALTDLVLQGEFEEIQLVAANALEQALLEETLSLDEWLNRLNEAKSALLQKALVPALTQALAASSRDIRVLLTQAAQPASPQLQQALAQAGLEKLRASSLFPVEEASLFIAGAGKRVLVLGQIKGRSPELQNAAGQVYGQLLAQTKLDIPMLEALVGDPTRSVEVRAAAASLLSKAWLDANLPLAVLEQRATGATPELRNAAVDALVQAYVGAVGRLELTQQSLADSVSTAQSQALALARAKALFVLLRSALVGLEAQVDLEAIVNGQIVTVRNVVVNGELQVFRQVAGNFLTGIYTFFGFIDRLEDPLVQLRAIATDEALSLEFRQAAGKALEVVFLADRRQALQTLEALRQLLEAFTQALEPLDLEAATASLAAFAQRLDQALALLVLTAEVAGDFGLRQALTGTLNRSLTMMAQALQQGRLLTVRSELSKVQQQLNEAQRSLEAAPDISTEMLLAFAGGGSTLALRQAAAGALEQRLLREGLSFEALWQLAQQGESQALQMATVEALAQAWTADLDSLYHFSQTGTSPAIRQAAALALVHSVEFSQFQLEDWLALASGKTVSLPALTLEGAIAPIRNAAAAALQAHFADAGVFSLDDLIERSVQGASEALQWGAAVALTQRLLDAKLGESELFRLIGGHTLLFDLPSRASEALSFALTQALAAALGHVSVKEEKGQTPLLKS